MATQNSTALGLAGGTLPSLALTTAESTYTFTYTIGSRPQNRSIQFLADAAWLFSTSTGANFVPVSANTPYEVNLPEGSVTYYAKTSAGTATLYAIISE